MWMWMVDVDVDGGCGCGWWVLGVVSGLFHLAV